MAQISTSTKPYPFDATTATNTYSNDYCWHRLPCGMCSLTQRPCLKPIKRQYPFNEIHCGGNSNVTSTNDCT